MNLELRLSVEDSPNSAAVVLDAIRCCKVALDRGIGGALTGPSAFFCKHPPQQFSDDVAHQLTEEFIAAKRWPRNELRDHRGGSREPLAGYLDSKPLTPVAGVPLIEHVVRRAAAAGGVNRFVVVTGHEAERLERSSPIWGERLGLPIESGPIEDWTGPTAIRCSPAPRRMDGDYLLMMSDHLFDPEIMRRLPDAPAAGARPRGRPQSRRGADRHRRRDQGRLASTARSNGSARRWPGTTRSNRRVPRHSRARLSD